MSGTRILFAGRDTKLRDKLDEYWAAHARGEIVEAQTFAEASEKSSDGLYASIVLEMELQGGNACALCRSLRQAGVTCPIIVIGESASDADAIASLNAGANDFVARPFSYSVLTARIDAQLRSYRSSEQAVYAIGPYTFRPSDKVLMENNKRIRLTEKESNVLKHLLRSGRTVSREALLSDVWGYNPTATTHTLETHIYRLRRKIEKDLSRFQLLLTENSGYRLNA
nr:MAG: response regulator transcription factor [Hyphomicrobiales bacterium]